MKNITILNLIIILGIILGGFYLASKTNNEQIDINQNETTYSILEKDSFYTEEEGKYENLSDEGKNLLRSLFFGPECENNPNKIFCYKNDYTLSNTYLISLKNEIALFDVPNEKPGRHYVIYDLKQKQTLFDSIPYFGTKVINDEFIFLVSDINKWENKTAQSLVYYKPGMKKFESVPSSEILPTESYWYYGGMGSKILETSFKEKALSITIFDEWKGEIGVTIPEKIKEVTFDLNNL